MMDFSFNSDTLLNLLSEDALRETTRLEAEVFLTADQAVSSLGIDPEAIAPPLSGSGSFSSNSSGGSSGNQYSSSQAFAFSNAGSLGGNAAFWAQFLSPSLVRKRPGATPLRLVFGTAQNDVLRGSGSDDIVFAFGGADTVFGGGGSDRIFGGQGADILNGETGNDLLYGGSGNDLLDGGTGDDRLLGEQGDDGLKGSRGNDLLDGGAGQDVANYSDLGKPITLWATGKVGKADLGSDQLKAIEVIVGARNQRNKLDGASITGSSTNLDVDLATNTVQVKDIPGLGQQTFTLQNFTEVIGSPNNDKILGDDNANFLFGRAGNDLLDGKGGNDTLDGGDGNDTVLGGGGNDRILASAGSDRLDGGSGYDSANYNSSNGITLTYFFDRTATFLGQPAPNVASPILLANKNGGELKPVESFQALPGESDRLENIEQISGAVGKTNSINFSIAAFGNRSTPSFETALAPAIDLDLGAKRLQYGTQQLQVENFSNVLGSIATDRITGDEGNNQLDGFYGNDTLKGGGGNDTLMINSGDGVTGGAGSDRFTFLAASLVTHFRGGSAAGVIEPNQIMDFERGRDRLVFENSTETRVQVAAEQAIQYIPFSQLATGSLPLEQFVVLGKNPITEATKFIYNGASGDLFYRTLASTVFDTSGQSKIATLQGAPSLSARDFLII